MKRIAVFAFTAMMAFVMVSCGEETTEDTTGDEIVAASNSGDVEATQSSSEQFNKALAEKAEEASVSDLPSTSVSWTEEKHDFGKIQQGEKVNHTFKFTNTGDNPLKVENVKASCGCTTPNWSKEDVPPGGEGFIEVQFDSKGKNGVQNKSVTVTANIDGKIKVLSFTGEVVAE